MAQDGLYEGPGYKRVGGIQGDPAMKRGVDLGWDKGYLAGKAEVEQGVNPDPTRFEDYNDPNKWYRYEFGKRGIFIRGFRGGFLKGYSYGLQQQVQYKAPLNQQPSRYADSTEATMGLPGVQATAIDATGFLAPQAPVPSRAKSKPKVKPQDNYSRVLSDAL